jgi:hypothetical protein
MDTNAAARSMAAIDCCPSLEPCAVCDVLEFPYRLPFRPTVVVGDQRQVVTVEVTLRFRLERCSGGLALGDVLYSTTLLPGEQVRLFTSDRHSRFTFDSESKLAYRQHTTSEESFFLAGMANSMSNLSVVENSNRSQNFHESAVGGGGSAGVDLGFVSFGGSVSASSHDASSTDAFARRLSQHADASSHHVETGVRAASSTQIGEVSNRAHSEGESEDHFESSSRVFTNPNHCHALSFLFYRVNKCQTLKWTLVSIDRHVDDPAAPTGVELNPAPVLRHLGVIPDAVIASAKDRPDAARRALDAVAIEQAPGQAAGVATGFIGVRALALAATFVPQPIPANIRAAALAQVTAELQKEGLLDDKGEVSDEAKRRYNWERTLALPTPGVVVKACLDDCSACEPELERSIQLDLEHKRLENELLKRKIELLDKSQEYRCCPDNDADTPTP